MVLQTVLFAKSARRKPQLPPRKTGTKAKMATNMARMLAIGSLPATGFFITSVKAAGKKVHPMELDIYDKPALVQEIIMEEPPSDLEMKVSSSRKQIIGYWDSLKNIFGRGQLLVQTANVKTSEFMELISTDQTFQIKVAAISTGVFVGAIAAGRGRRPVRRIFYSTALGFIAFSICYPNKAWIITQRGFENSKALYNKVKTMYEEQKQKRLTESQEEVTSKTSVQEQEFVEEAPQQLPLVEIQEVPKPSEEEIQLTEMKESGATSFTNALDSKEGERSYLSYIPFLGWFFKNTQSSDTQEQFTTEAAKEIQIARPDVDIQNAKSEAKPLVKAKRVGTEVVGDHGQSNPEDKDMYSTRD